jgi:TPR repeat protein
MVARVQATPEADFQKGKQAFHRDDVVGAMGPLRRSAEQGYAPAQVLLAYILDRAEENTAAIALYRKAAEQGSAEGMYGLATMYAAGEGVEPQDAVAVQWFTRAMEAGHEPARFLLANAYLSGQLGLGKDEVRGMELLRQGAAAGYEPARERLDDIAAKKAKGQ